MFRRLQSGLPKDPVFAKDLKGLGYFVNEKDEVRNIENPKAYFNFFLNKNERYNMVQRESMNEAIKNIIAERLESLGLTKLRLPLGASETDRHVNIFISNNLKEKKEIIVLFYEAGQDLGVFAHRVIGGKGGINAGSAVNFVKYILDSALKDGKEAPGVVIANLGQLYWSSRAKKSLSLNSWYALPRKSAADPHYDYDEYKNSIPGNKSTAEHVAYVFNKVLGNPDVCDQQSKIHVLGVSEGASQATWFLHRPENFERWCVGMKPAVNDNWVSKFVEKVDMLPTNCGIPAFGADDRHARVISLASVGTSVTVAENPESANPQFLEITNSDFKNWFANRGRAYALSYEPAGQFLAPPEGNKLNQPLGAPTFSLGESIYSERMLVVGHKIILDWFVEVAADHEYANPKLERHEIDEEAASIGIGNLWGKGDVIEQKPLLIENISKVKEDEAVQDAAPIFTEPIVIPQKVKADEKEALEKLNSVFKMLNSGKELSKQPLEQVDDGTEDTKGHTDTDVDDDFEAGLSMENVISFGRRNDGYTYDPEIGE